MAGEVSYLKFITLHAHEGISLGAGMVVMAIPIFTSQLKGSSISGDNVADRTEYYTTAKNLLIQVVSCCCIDPRLKITQIQIYLGC